MDAVAATMPLPTSGDLRGAFYSEFDNVLGPKVVYHAGECPVGDVFDRVSDYVITKPQLVSSSRTHILHPRVPAADSTSGVVCDVWELHAYVSLSLRASARR